MSGSASQGRCERTRAWAALAPDGELSLLERRLVDAHLARCAPCRSFAEQVAAVAEELRRATLERSARRLPRAAHRSRSGDSRMRGVAAVAATAAISLGIATQAPLVRGGDPPSAPSGTAPAEVDDAELHMIRQLRREAILSRLAYPERPSPTFGNQPA